MSSRIVRFLLAFVFIAALPAFAEDPFGKALLFTKSVGFQHDPVAEANGQPSLAEKILRELLSKQGIALDATKDGSLINAKNLANYKLVLFYTQGDLTQVGNFDKKPPMGPDGVKDLVAWIENGGGFMAFHSGADTLRPATADAPATPYTAMVGAAFKSHGKQFSGTVKVVDPKHPIMKGIKDGWSFADEWYVFTHLDTKNMHVLALLDAGPERAKQEMYNLDPYPIVWCKALGKGRVYYNAMGHRPDVWETKEYQLLLTNAANWAVGKTDLDAKPNSDKVVPKGKH